MIGKGPHMEVDGAGQLYLAGRRVFLGGWDELIGEIGRLAAEPRKTLVVTPNVDLVLRLELDEAWRKVYDNADLRIVDGMPLIILGRLLGAERLMRLTGSDLLIRAVSSASRHGWRIAMVGGTETSRREAVRNLSGVNPKAEIKAFGLPRLRIPSDPASLVTVCEMNAWQPQIVFLCLGNPKQELWFRAWEPDLPNGVYVGAGAAMDFAAGVQSRAPRLLQSLSIEWAWRLIHEPKRLAYRYLIRGPRFLLVAARSVSHRASVVRRGFAAIVLL